MQTHPNFHTNEIDSEHISLKEILHVVWQGRWTILTVTLLAAACSLAWALLSAMYISQGFFQFGGTIPTMEKVKPIVKAKDENELERRIRLSDFRRFAAALAVPDRFEAFVREKNLESTPGIDELHNVLESTNRTQKLIHPISSFANMYSKSAELKDGNAIVVGMRVDFPSKSPQIAQQMAKLLGRYAMDRIIYLASEDQLSFRIGELRTKLTKLDASIADQMVSMEDYRRRIASLKKIVARNSGAPETRSRQIISITEGMAHYLPPVTLLLSTEVQAAEADLQIQKDKRELAQTALLLQYYEHASKELENAKSGENFVLQLNPLKERMFKGRDLHDSGVKQAYNLISVDNEVATNVYLRESRFILEPNLPTFTTGRLTVIVLIATIFGVFLSLVLVFAQKWWRRDIPQASVQP
jgi:hypothetical protein